jgi:serine/tyrosine/threonine adenylyltransferase
VHALRFDNAMLRELPGDPDRGPGERRVPGAVFARVEPRPVAAPRLLAYSAQMAERLGFDDADVADPLFAQVFAGNALMPGMDPFATGYGGHQFGHWAGQLGDGRAISLGEAVNAAGERWELQLKGAGRTPYSRGADGRAVLRSSLREFVLSEAMHHLGVPTTRALSLVVSDDRVVRDMFYDGHAEAEPVAVVCRTAPSFIRFGHFELPAARGDTALLRQLVDFTIARDFPHLGGDADTRLGDWFGEIAERTAELMAQWMRVGFVHGVMNTDNMSVLGLTLDYGPFGWLEQVDPDFTPNTTDLPGRRYRFGRQPQIAYWNLGRLAAALSPLCPDPAPLREGLARYAREFEARDRANAAAKLGLSTLHEADLPLVAELYQLMHQSAMDLTLTYDALTEHGASTTLAHLGQAGYDADALRLHADAWRDWLRAWTRRADSDPLPAAERRARMRGANPVYVPRNYLLQQAIERAEQGDAGGIEALMEVLRTPYQRQGGREAFAARCPEWARDRAGCSMLSCSS